MFYEELNLKDQGVSKTQIEETRQLLNIFMSSNQEDQALHQCILEIVNLICRVFISFIHFFKEKETNIFFWRRTCISLSFFTCICQSCQCPPKQNNCLG